MRWSRFCTSLLSRPAGPAGGETAAQLVARVASALGGVQAQCMVPAALAVWNRRPPGVALGCAEARAALAQAGPLVARVTGQRGTLHAYAAADWQVVAGALGARLDALCEHQVRRGHVTGIKGEGEVEALRRAAAYVRAELAAGRAVTAGSLEAAGHNKKLRYRAFMKATTAGAGALAHASDSETPRIAPFAAGSPAWAPLVREEALRTLALRYARAFAPVTAADFAYWAGCPVSDARAAFEGEAEAASAAAAPADAEPAAGDWPVRLLGRFDPLLLAHKSKAWCVEERWRGRVWSHSNVAPCIFVRGRIRGMWSYRLRAAGATILLRPFGRALDPAERRGAEAEACDMVAGFFELASCTVEESDEFVD